VPPSLQEEEEEEKQHQENEQAKAITTPTSSEAGGRGVEWGLDSAGGAVGLECGYIGANTESIGYNDPDLAVAGQHPEASQRFKEDRQALIKPLLRPYQCSIKAR
jgi:hypothetical protein